MKKKNQTCMQSTIYGVYSFSLSYSLTHTHTYVWRLFTSNIEGSLRNYNLKNSHAYIVLALKFLSTDNEFKEILLFLKST